MVCESKYPVAFLLVLSLLASSAGAAPDPVGWWKLDEGMGSSAVDSSGNGITGIIVDAVWVSPGWHGGGFCLELADNAHVDLGNPASLNFGTGDWAITAWVKNTMTGTGDENKGTIYANGGDNSGGHRYALAISEVTEGVITLTTDDNATKLQATATTPVNDDEWHFVVGMRSGTTILVYTDGREEGSNTTVPAGYDLSGTSQHDAYLGAITANDTSSLFKTFDGLIDDVRVFGQALTDAEVAEVMTGLGSSKYSGGAGTEEDPYQIATAQDLIALGNAPVDYDKYFVVTRDIDMAGEVFSDTIIASGEEFWGDQADGTKFTGDFDGNGHVIRNLTIDSLGSGSSYIGLFGYTYFQARIYDLGVENCKIASDGMHTGAIVGRNHGGTIERCYAQCDITCNGRVAGGIVGTSWYGTIADCYTEGRIQGDWAVGGIAGRILADVKTCYSVAQVIGNSDVGGVVGDGEPGSVSLCFWDVESSGVPASYGGFGRTTSQMNSASTFIGWGANWTIEEGYDYPRLAWEDAMGTRIDNIPTRTYVGAGTENNPFLLSQPDDFLVLCARADDWSWHNYFELTDDIDMSQISGYLPIGRFGGRLNGNGFTIRNLTIDLGTNTSFVGLIGYANNSVVSDLRIENPFVRGGNCCGALMGKNQGTVLTSCSSEFGSVQGTMYAGGLVGITGENSIMSSCYNDTEVSGVAYVGGLTGFAWGNLTNCYSKGVVKATEDYAGGVAGYSRDDMANCYNSGPVECPGIATGSLIGMYAAGTMSSCFWDTQSSGQETGYILDTSSYPGPGTVVNSEGRTTTHMRNQADYVSAGWDFVGETANGTDDIWKMSLVTGYPILTWQADVLPTLEVEGFESGSFSMLVWSHSDGIPWTVTAEEHYAGTFSAQAGPVGSGQSTSLSVVLECRAGEISFWQKVSCHSTMAGLEFYIDDELVASWSGRREWEQASFPVTGGTHTFTWTYSKTGWSSLGEDTAWIDDIVFPVP